MHCAHKLEPRFHYEKVGQVENRIYICDICVKCGRVFNKSKKNEEYFLNFMEGEEGGTKSV